MVLSLVNITLQEDRFVAELRELSEEVSLDIDVDNLKLVNQVATLALQAFQSTVPIYEKQLRDANIQINYAKKNQSLLSASVYITDAPHNSSPKPTGPGRSYLSNSRLAEVLDSGVDSFPKKGGGKLNQILHRSKSTEGAGPYGAGIHGAKSGTAGWISSGYEQLVSVLDKRGLIS